MIDRRILYVLFLALITACKPDAPGVPEVGTRPGYVSGANSRPQAIEETVRLFDAFPLVGVGEPHGNVEIHELIVALVWDDTFADAVDVIVVEFGNAFYQDMLDRYVSGEDVPEDSITAVWRTTTQLHGVWDAPMYGRFFEQVRNANRSRLSQRQIRVLAGDPPLDWTIVSTGNELGQITSRRTSYFVDLVRREVLDPGYRALLIIGGAHLDTSRSGTVASLIRTAAPGSLYTIQPIRSDAALSQWADRLDSLEAPAILSSENSWFGEEDAAILFGGGSRMIRRGGEWIQEPLPLIRRGPIDAMTDALLYLGPVGSLTSAGPPDSLSRDIVYCREYRLRWTLVEVPADTTHPCWK